MSSHPLEPRRYPVPAKRPPLVGEIVDDKPARSPLVLLDLVSYIMDRLVPVPGTRFRVGLNSLVLLLPVVGDLLTSLISAGIVVVGLTNYRVPRIVAVRMILNVVLDAGLGWIPLLGDLFDAWYKADTRNVALLREYLSDSGPPPRATWRHWVFVVGLLAALVVILIGILVGVALLIRALLHQWR